ncbi:MAG: hypothetical protein HQ541_10345 [Mariniphaga sp.]|nr:hypothetical protein [Mariniphaga sp.]
MNLFNKENSKEKKPKQYSMAISVLNSEVNWVQLPGFNMTVSQAISFILKKFNLPLEASEQIRLKYFLFRPSVITKDGYEILAENDSYGNPLQLDEYGIYDGIKLNLGAIVLPKESSEIHLIGDDEKTDDEIIEI